MPVLKGKDGKGGYYRWGKNGAKYYFENGNEISRMEALKKAREQERAAYARGYGREDAEEDKVKTIIVKKDRIKLKKVIF